MFKRIRLVATLIIVAQTNSGALAESWPQWMGPNRNNVWQNKNAISKFPQGGPDVLWRSPVAGGYSGPAVVGDRVYVSDYVTADDIKVPNFERKQFSGLERVLCLDASSGDVIWKRESAVKYRISYPAGPRCTPTVDEDCVYTLGAEGHLFCFNKDSGEEIWSKDFQSEYKTKPALWGYASHPLVDGDKLICIVGGEGSHAVAFHKKTGDELWRTLTAKEQGYSPPTIIDAGGRRQLILLRPDGVSSVDPETGTEYWTEPYEATSGSIIMSPLQWSDYLYAAGYSNKNILIKLAGDEAVAETVWRDELKKGVSPVNVQPFLDGNVIYGFDQSGTFCGVELPSGNRLWETPEPLGKRPVASGTAFIIRQGTRYWLFTEQGDLIICKLSKDGYQEIDRAKVIEPTNVAFGRDVVWSAPAFANGRAYIRNDKECLCIELSQK